MSKKELQQMRLEHANQTLGGHYPHNGTGIREAHKDGYYAGASKMLELVQQKALDIMNSTSEDTLPKRELSESDIVNTLNELLDHFQELLP
jgi:hypothetical protein